MNAMEEVLQQVADMALFMEDNIEDVMDGPRGYSVNINFRKEGETLFASVEAYGNGKHLSRTRSFPMMEKRMHRRNRNMIIGAIVAGALAFGLTMLIK